MQLLYADTEAEIGGHDANQARGHHTSAVSESKVGGLAMAMSRAREARKVRACRFCWNFYTTVGNGTGIDVDELVNLMTKVNLGLTWTI